MPGQQVSGEETEQLEAGPRLGARVGVVAMGALQDAAEGTPALFLSTVFLVVVWL